MKKEIHPLLPMTETTSPRHVLILLDTFHIGGVTAFMQQHSQILLHPGAIVTIIGSRGNLEDPRNFFPGCRLEFVSADTGAGNIAGRVGWGIRYVIKLFSVLHSHRIDTIYSSMTYSAVFSLLIPYTWSKKRIYAFCGDYALEMQSSTPKQTLGFIIKNMLRYMAQYCTIASAHSVITFSMYAQHLLKRRFHCPEVRITVIPAFIQSRKSGRLRDRHSLKILAVSRLEPRKGIDILLQALAQLKRKIPDFQATIVCAVEDDAYFSSVFKLYESLDLFTNVQFLHKATTRQLNELMDTQDLFVMPSRDLETFGFILLHAVSRGLIPLATAVGSLPEIIQDIDSRLLIRKPDPMHVYQRIVWFHNLPLRDRRTLQQQMYRITTEKYSQKQISPQIQALFFKP